MKVRWTGPADQDRLEIWNYLTARDLQAAIRMDERFSAAAGLITEFPNAGRAGLVAGTRELIPHPSYRLVYEIFGETAWILALIHTSRQWPPAEEDED